MRLSFDAPTMLAREVSGAALGLAAWYDSKPDVRRLWGIRNADSIRVIVVVQATHDNSDVLPVWLACSTAWASELRRYTGAAVQLELLDDQFGGMEIEADGVIIADLYWRDATLNRPNEVL
jgi:hypothetical protein